MTEIECSFCDKTLKDVKRMVAGKRDSFICDECIMLCFDIVRELYATNMLPTSFSSHHLANPANGHK